MKNLPCQHVKNDLLIIKLFQEIASKRSHLVDHSECEKFEPRGYG